MVLENRPHFGASKEAPKKRTPIPREKFFFQFAASRGVCFAYFMNIKDAPLIITTFSAWKSASRQIRRRPARENPAPLSPLPPDLPLLYIGLRSPRTYNVQREQALPVIRRLVGM